MTDPVTLSTFYAENLQSSFFAGFLTLGTFLFAVKTFIIVKLKEDVFDTNFYRKRLNRQQSLNAKKHVPHYKPLKNFASLIFWSAIISVATSILQLTVGLVDNFWCSLFCIIMAGASIVLLISSLIVVKININIWLASIEESSQEARKKNQGDYPEDI
jgi:hypothetical protein